VGIRVDMHIHTNASNDAFILMRHIGAVFERGKVDMLVVLDHNSIDGALEAKKIWENRIIVGEEIDTGEGEIAGIFLKERIPPHMGIFDTISALKEQKATIYLPHPFDKGRPILHTSKLIDFATTIDIVECYNSKVKKLRYNAMAHKFAEKNGCLKGAGSDAHLPCEIGAAYVILPQICICQEAFIAALNRALIRGRRQRLHERLLLWGMRTLGNVKKFFC